MPFPKVCVIVLNWNTWQATCDCLESLKRVDYPNCQIVTVDNGSTNDSADQLAARFPEITLIRNSENRGFAGGNNVGIRYALQHEAEYVLLLNNDTVVSSHFLSAMIAVAEADDRVGILCPKIYYHEPADRIWYAGGTFNFWHGFARHRGCRQEDGPRFNRTRIVTFATGCALLIRSIAIHRVGFLDERFFMVSEDTDWCLRSRHAGYKIVYVADSAIWHRESYTIRTTKGKPFRDYYNARNRLLLARKHAQWYHWPTFVICSVAYVLYRTAAYIVLGQWRRVGALFKGLRDGFTDAPDFAPQKVRQPGKPWTTTEAADSELV